jgi:hypothetical protein
VPTEGSRRLCRGFKLAGDPTARQVDLNALMNVVERMKATPQHKWPNGNMLSVYEHGRLVEHTLMENLVPFVKGKDSSCLGGLHNKKLPSWLTEYREFIASNLYSNHTLSNYARFHDIGKPFCMVEDETGRAHFPDHAKVSYQKYMELFDDEEVGNLILHDMDIHLMKDVDVKAFCCSNSKQTCVSLLLTSLAEVYSNAGMFGGFESESFKIKFKAVERRGNAICRLLAR